ncbi:integrator complex subunit 1 isoform X2 [Aphidius gifuensis]|uniref:integrator complex subunit 1 isoform X2 n=1 Tax=Aphidius gifuensis TaxID=684658 RepID=UPI001CDC0180|nr:integrator complex subunit 1 isoform X2 [Aphidius gifuensis]
MERTKPGIIRGSKSKLTQPVPGDHLFVLGGSKNSRNDATDLKRPGVIHGKTGLSSSSSSSSSTTTTDRKKECGSSQSLNPPPIKKPKLSGPVSALQRAPMSSAEAWEVVACDCEPWELVPMVLEASDNDEGDKVIGIICGAIKNLKTYRWKPDPLLYHGLLVLAKMRPSIFSNDCILHALSSLLKRDQSFVYKTKNPNNLVSVLAANLLMHGYQDKKNWPDVFIKLYIEDSLGDRNWVDHDECKCFTDNIMTAFNTRHPPKSALQNDTPTTLASSSSSSVVPSRDCHSPIAMECDDDSGTSIIAGSSGAGGIDKSEYNIIPRYSNSSDSIELIMSDTIKEPMARRQQDTITKNFLKLLSTTCGLSYVRSISITKLELWLHNPKLTKPAQELLIYICYNSTTHTMRDVEVISHLAKMRFNTKILFTLYLNGIKELINLHSENLSAMMKHTIYNQLSNTRNQNNMAMLAVIFQSLPDASAKILAEIFQDLLLGNKEDYLRALRAFFRDIVRVCKHDLNLLTVARTLIADRPLIYNLINEYDYKERLFSSIIDLLCLCMLLGKPQIKDTSNLVQRGDKKDTNIINQFQTLVSTIQYETTSWLNNPQTITIYGINKITLLHALHKIMFLESSDQYYKIDNWPPESERSIYMRSVSEVPLLQSTLLRILMMGFPKENGIGHGELLEVADQLIRRAAQNATELLPTLKVDKIEMIELIFNLCVYQPPTSINIPSGYVPPTLAISNLYWKSWIIVLILAAHNPLTIGAAGWKKYPILRTLMEMCITNHFSYPPPTMALPEIIEAERAKELQIETLEKQDILEYESHLAAASTKVQISETNSLLLSQLINMDPTGIARRPPQLLLEQLQNLNITLRLGHLLCRSREPDFLLDIIQRQQQSSSQSMPWLADLVKNSEGSLNQLPVQCLCEFLLSTTAQAVDKQPRQQQLLQHLQKLLTDPNEDQKHPFEVLEYFLRRLSSQQSGSRLQAITGLKLVLDLIPLVDDTSGASASRKNDNKNDVNNDEDDDDDDDDNNKDNKLNINSNIESEIWLNKKLPSIPHFTTIKSLVSAALRNACQVENNPELVRSYISYLSVHTKNDDLSELTDLVNEISQLVVERSTITAALLPEPENDCLQTRTTLQYLKQIFCNYLIKARLPRGEGYTWSESQDQILVQWETGEECTMHILVVHAMIILLTYDVTDDDDNGLSNDLLEIWFPENNEPPKAFLVDTSEEALLIPDWLKLRMIRSNVPRLVDAALRDLKSQQLVLFIQSFGIPVTSMTKLLQTLDHAVHVDRPSVDGAVLDKTYMAQLVEVQHRRGATGGLIFVRELELLEPPLPDILQIKSEKLQQPIPQSAMIKKQSVIQCSIKTDIPHLINRLFIENVTSIQKTEAFKRLHKTLAKDLKKLDNINCAVYLTIQHICTILSSMQVKQFLSSIINLPQYSCTLMRIILHPIKLITSTTNNNNSKNNDNNKYKQIIDLARSMCHNLIILIGDIKAPVLSIIHDFMNIFIIKKNNSNNNINNNNSNNNNITLLYNNKNNNSNTNDPGMILENTDSINLENIGRKLLDTCLKEQKNDILVESMVKLLVSDSNDDLVKPRTGLLIDWLASVEPELIGICPNLQMKLLFGKTMINIKINDKLIKTHECRPYLLTLLTHRASWTTLYKCVLHLLLKYDDNYDPTAVLDFLWALTCNPKLWQGRDKFTPKHYLPENILLLSESQILTVMNYLVAEAVIIYETKGNNFALRQMEQRLDLIQHCIGNDELIISKVVKYLADIMMINKFNSNNNIDDNKLINIKANMAHNYLLHMYMKIPKVICYLTQLQSRKFLSNANINNWNNSVLDCLSHALLTGLAAIPRQKAWSIKSQDFEICARKLAAVHPILVLRQLSMLPLSLIGRCHFNYNEFKSGNHFNVFTQTMGLLEILQPHIFNDEYRKAFENTLDHYLQCFCQYGRVKENNQFLTLINRFVTLLQSYVLHNAQYAFKYLHKNIHSLIDIQKFFSKVTSLRNLISSIPGPKEGTNGENIFLIGQQKIITNESKYPQHWPNLIASLGKLQGEDVYLTLQEIDNLSSRKPNVLESVIDYITDLLISPQGNIRLLAHSLIARAIKYKPVPNLNILAAYQRCLDSQRSDVLMTALDKLPDVIACMQEYALPLLQKIFELGVNSNVNTIPCIHKSLAILNTQRGC